MKCLCGCEQEINKGRKFISGHNSRVAGYTKGQFRKGNKSWNTGLTKDTDERLAIVGQKNAINPRILEILREGNTKHTEQTKNKTWEDIFGVDKAIEKKDGYSRKNSREGNPFWGKKHTQQSIALRVKKVIHKRVIRKCQNCQFEFEVIDTSKRKYCSHLCYSISRKGKPLSEKQKETIRQILLRQWGDPEFVKERCISFGFRPNKKEFKLSEIIGEINLPYKYVGDGQFVIGRKIPDFINVNGQKKAIELFGDYWHRGEDPQERIDLFREYGFETLVIWEKELKDEGRLKEKLLAFDNRRE